MSFVSGTFLSQVCVVQVHCRDCRCRSWYKVRTTSRIIFLLLTILSFTLGASLPWRLFTVVTLPSIPFVSYSRYTNLYISSVENIQLITLSPFAHFTSKHYHIDSTSFNMRHSFVLYALLGVPTGFVAAAPANSVARQRAAAVKEAFEFAWDGYYK